jgi:hypothetical protein
MLLTRSADDDDIIPYIFSKISTIPAGYGFFRGQVCNNIDDLHTTHAFSGTQLTG